MPLVVGVLRPAGPLPRIGDRHFGHQFVFAVEEQRRVGPVVFHADSPALVLAEPVLEELDDLVVGVRRTPVHVDRGPVVDQTAGHPGRGRIEIVLFASCQQSRCEQRNGGPYSDCFHGVFPLVIPDRDSSPAAGCCSKPTGRSRHSSSWSGTRAGISAWCCGSGGRSIFRRRGSPGAYTL